MFGGGLMTDFLFLLELFQYTQYEKCLYLWKLLLFFGYLHITYPHQHKLQIPHNIYLQVSFSKVARMLLAGSVRPNPLLEIQPKPFGFFFTLFSV